MIKLNSKIHQAVSEFAHKCATTNQILEKQTDVRLGYEYIIELLEESVKKNGEKPLTNKWLLNILKKTTRDLDYEDDMPDESSLPDNW